MGAGRERAALCVQAAGPARLDKAGIVSRRRIVRGLAIATSVVAIVLAGAILVSAAVDEPSQTARASTSVKARERDVWRLLADLKAYASWNPTIVKADGTLEEGATLELRFKNGDGNLENREVSVVDVNPIHKLRWQDRLLLPGVRDRELTIRVRSFRLGVTSVTATERYEGLLAPFADKDDAELGLNRMLAALRKRAEG
jgi:hypothetical protein